MVCERKWDGNFLRPAINGGSDVWSTPARKQQEMRLMQMLEFNKAVDQLTMLNSVHWCGHVLRMADVHVLRKVLEFEVEGQRKNGGHEVHGRCWWWRVA